MKTKKTGTQRIENLTSVTNVDDTWMVGHHDGKSVQTEDGEYYPTGWYMGWQEAPEDGCWLSGPFDSKEAAIAECKSFIAGPNAAAPELLRDLGRLVNVLDNSPAAVAARGFMSTEADVQRELAAAKATITKATGGRP